MEQKINCDNKPLSDDFIPRRERIKNCRISTRYSLNEFDLLVRAFGAKNISQKIRETSLDFARELLENREVVNNSEGAVQ